MPNLFADSPEGPKRKLYICMYVHTPPSSDLNSIKSTAGICYRHVGLGVYLLAEMKFEKNTVPPVPTPLKTVQQHSRADVKFAVRSNCFEKYHHVWVES